MTRSVRSFLASALAFLPAAALAHTGTGDTTGLAHGFMHAVTGLDHVLAMVAVGIFAAHLGGRSLWVVPASFVLMMAIGGALGAAGLELPYVEFGIGLSIVVLGAAIGLRLNIPAAAAMALVGFFAIFHGHAHGAEMPDNASGSAYGMGFLMATSILHALGLGLGGFLPKTGRHSRQIERAAGAAMSLVGIAILSDLL